MGGKGSLGFRNKSLGSGFVGFRAEGIQDLRVPKGKGHQKLKG